MRLSSAPAALLLVLLAVATVGGATGSARAQSPSPDVAVRSASTGSPAHTRGVLVGDAGVPGATDVRSVSAQSGLADLTILPEDFAAPSTGGVGEEINQVAVVRNFGPNDSTGGVVNFRLYDSVPYRSSPTRDPCSPNYLAGVLSCPIPPLAVGEVRTVAIVVVPVREGRFDASATVFGIQADPDTSNNGVTRPAQYSLQTDLGLEIEMPGTVGVGQETFISAKATNFGPSASSGATVRFQLPTGLVFRRVSSEFSCASDPSAGLVSCRVGQLRRGANAQVKIDVLVNVVGAFRVEAAVLPDGNDPNLNNNADVRFATAVGPSCPPRRDVPVRVEVINAGDNRFAVRLTANPVPRENRLQRVRIVETNNAAVDIGQRVGAVGFFAVELDDRPSVLSFSVRRTSPGLPTLVKLVVVDDCGEFATFVGGGTAALGPDLVVALSATPAIIRISESVVYTATVSNNSATTAQGVTLSDTLPPQLALQTASANCSGTSPTRCALGTIPRGGSQTATIVANAVDDGTVINTVSASSTNVDQESNGANNTASARTTVISCSPRPNVDVQQVAFGTERIQVFVTAGTDPDGAPANVLRSLSFGEAGNAVIEIGGQTLTGNQNYTLPTPDRQVVFFVRRQTPGAPSRVVFTAVDVCGGLQRSVQF